MKSAEEMQRDSEIVYMLCFLSGIAIMALGIGARSWSLFVVMASSAVVGGMFGFSLALRLERMMRQ